MGVFRWVDVRTYLHLQLQFGFFSLFYKTVTQYSMISEVQIVYGLFSDDFYINRYFFEIMYMT